MPVITVDHYDTLTCPHLPWRRQVPGGGQCQGGYRVGQTVHSAGAPGCCANAREHTTNYFYDELNRLVSVTDPFTGAVSYGYNLAGNRTQLTYPDPSAGSGQGGRVVTNTYDADNRLVQVRDWDGSTPLTTGGGLTRYAYDAVGRLVNTTLPNGVVTTHQYDAANRLIQIKHKNVGNELLARYTYVLDSAGNQVQAMETISVPSQGLVTTTITYTYDSLYRLNEADYSSGEWFVYTYDAIGNRTAYTATITQTTVTSYSYDAANLLTRRVVDGSVVYTYTWSDAGRMTGEWQDDSVLRAFDYDHIDRLASATVGHATTRFAYLELASHQPARISMTVEEQGTTTFTLDLAWTGVELIQHNPEVIQYYLHGSTPIAVNDSEWRYYLQDRAGSVRQLADADGNIILEVSYQPFGKVLNQTGIAYSDRGFGGGWSYPNFEFIYYAGAWYDPRLGHMEVPGIQIARKTTAQRVWQAYLSGVLVGLFSRPKLSGNKFSQAIQNLTVVETALTGNRNIPPTRVFSSRPSTLPPDLSGCDDSECVGVQIEVDVWGLRWFTKKQWPLEGPAYGAEAKIHIWSTQMDSNNIFNECVVVQWVKGYRKLKEPNSSDWINDDFFYPSDYEKNFVIDTVKRGDTPSLNRYFDPSNNGWEYIDHPKHSLEAKQSIEWKEHFITAVYDRDIEPLLPKGHEEGRPENFKSVAQAEWNLDNTVDPPGYYTCSEKDGCVPPGSDCYGSLLLPLMLGLLGILVLTLDLLRKKRVMGILFALGLALILVTGCGDQCAGEGITLQTNAEYYNPQKGPAISASLRNCSGNAISGTTLFNLKVYFQEPVGWRQLGTTGSCRFADRKEDPVLKAGETREWNIGDFAYCHGLDRRTGYFVLVSDYTLLGLDGEFAIFSNEFIVGDNPDLERDLDAGVSLENLEQGQIRFYNNRLDESVWKTIWFVPFCAEDNLSERRLLPTTDWSRRRELYSTLQRQTTEGSWQVILPDPIECLKTFPSIEIKPGNNALIELWQGYPVDRLDLPAGTYRWDVVYFLAYSKSGRADLPRHLFTEEFELFPYDP